VTDPAVHAIEAFTLGFVTFGLVVYFLVALFVMFADRPFEIGRNDDGSLRVARPVRRQP